MDVTNRSARRETVVGVFRSRPEAERAIQDLRDAGFREDQIGILTHDGDRGTGGTNVGEGNKSGEAAGIGAIIGGLIGAGAALLIPGIGPVIAGGILAGVLGGAAVGAAAGGIIGALVGLGIPEHEARYYEGEFKQGRTLVTVKSADRYDEARRILRRDGAYDIQDQQGSGSPAGRESPNLTAAPPASGTGSRENVTAGQETRIPVTEEELVARKRQEQVGEVDITKRVVREQQTMEVPVTHDEVRVERRQVDEPVSSGAQPFREETIRIPLTEEEVTTEKRPRVVGEVVVEKERVTREQPVSGTVRREEVEVNRRNSGGAGFGTWAEAMPTYRSAWQRQYGSTGGRWEDVEPYYQYGYTSWNNPRYRNQEWSAVEPGLRQEWTTSHPNTPWDRVRAYVQQVWDNSRRAA